MLGQRRSPWALSVSRHAQLEFRDMEPGRIPRSALALFDEAAFLGLAAVLCVYWEMYRVSSPLKFWQFDRACLLDTYLGRRRNQYGHALSNLPVPVQFRQVFLDWAEGKVDFVKMLDE
jgi:hypothetical protein